MRGAMRLLFLALAVLGAPGGPAWGQGAEAAVAAILRAGGVVIYFRHTATDWSRADAVELDLKDCGTQRILDAGGRRDAAAIGVALRALGVVAEPVVTSEYCRARETATRMGFADARTDPLLNDVERMPARGPSSPASEALRERLRTDPGAGKTALIVAHRPNIVDAEGGAFADLAEGEAVVFGPSAAGFVMVARIPVAAWPAIMAARP